MRKKTIITNCLVNQIYRVIGNIKQESTLLFAWLFAQKTRNETRTIPIRDNTYDFQNSFSWLATKITSDRNDLSALVFFFHDTVACTKLFFLLRFIWFFNDIVTCHKQCILLANIYLLDLQLDRLVFFVNSEAQSPLNISSVVFPAPHAISQSIGHMIGKLFEFELVRRFQLCAGR